MRMYLIILPIAVIVIEKEIIFIQIWVIQLFLNRALADRNSQGNRPCVIAAGRRCMKGSALFRRGAEICVFNLIIFHVFFHQRSNISLLRQTSVGPGLEVPRWRLNAHRAPSPRCKAENIA